MAVDRALKSLWTGECEMALAGGVNVILLESKTDPQGDPPAFADFCFSACRRRTFYSHRLTMVAANETDFREQLHAFLSRDMLPAMANGVRRHSFPRVAFVFGGQGPQWWHMGQELFSSEPVFRDTVERCNESIRRQGSGWSLVEELKKREETTRIHQTEIAQPAIFSVQVGLLELWKSWGITPDAVIGHSVGEAAGGLRSRNLSPGGSCPSRLPPGTLDATGVVPGQDAGSPVGERGSRKPH